MQEIFVSVDVEANGPDPRCNSLMSIGAVVYDVDSEIVDKFYINIETLAERPAHPQTTKFWQTEPVAWWSNRVDVESPKRALEKFDFWLASFKSELFFVAHPAEFDFNFINQYLLEYVGHNRFGNNVIDLTTFGGRIMGFETKVPAYYWPDEWTVDDLPYTHNALDDALFQGAIFAKMLKAARTNSLEKPLYRELPQINIY